MCRNIIGAFYGIFVSDTVQAVERRHIEKVNEFHIECLSQATNAEWSILTNGLPSSSIKQKKERVKWHHARAGLRNSLHRHHSRYCAWLDAPFYRICRH